MHSQNTSPYEVCVMPDIFSEAIWWDKFALLTLLVDHII